jgi:hypothetical protein
MKELAILLLGWGLGLFSPLIVDAVKAHFNKKNVRAALRAELEDTEMRLAVTSLSLKQSHGQLDKKFLAWLRPILEKYSGDEAIEGTKALVAKIADDEKLLEQVGAAARAREGVGSNLKTIRTAFLDSHLSEILQMPVALQKRIHEFRIHLDLFNQDVSKSREYQMMSFDSSLTPENHDRVITDLKDLYGYLAIRAQTTVDKIESVLKVL